MRTQRIRTGRRILRASPHNGTPAAHEFRKKMLASKLRGGALKDYAEQERQRLSEIRRQRAQKSV